MGAVGDVARDFVEVELHHVGVGIGQGKGRADAAGGADRAEQIGVVIALVGGLPGSRSASGPLPNLAVLLADPGFVFKPDFEGVVSGSPFKMSRQCVREVFLKRLDDPLVLSWMTRPRAHVGEAELLEKLSDIAWMKVDAEPLGDDTLEVEPTPAHDAVLLTIRAGFDYLRELGQLLHRKARLGTLRPAVDEALRTRRLKRWTQSRSVWRSMPPIFAAGTSVHSVPDRSQRQKPPALVDVLRPPGQRRSSLAE